METCKQCSQVAACAPNGLCHEVDGKGERIVGTGCYGAMETSEAARNAAIGAAIGVAGKDVTPDKLEAAAKIAGCEWHEVTPEKLAGKEIEVRAAVEALAKAEPAEAKP